MNKHAISVGILGLGNFGSFAASLIPSHISVVGYDPDTNKGASLTLGTFEEVCAADVIILAIPLSTYPETFAKLRPLLRPETLVIDVCSVKELPQALFAELLPHHANILLTHPLFGPQSAAKGTQGCHLIVTKQSGERAQQVVDFCKTTLGLRVTMLSSEEHDRSMAQVHALTFFVARALAQMKLDKTPFETPSYKMITDLVAFDQSHTDELFNTIELGNTYSRDVRESLRQTIEHLCKELDRREVL